MEKQCSFCETALKMGPFIACPNCKNKPKKSQETNQP
jgi:hypothetical protein